MAPPTPALRSCRMICSRQPRRSRAAERISQVRSVEASATITMRSTSAGIVSRTRPTSFSSLYAGTTTATQRPSNMSAYSSRGRSIAAQDLVNAQIRGVAVEQPEAAALLQLLRAREAEGEEVAGADEDVREAVERAQLARAAAEQLVLGALAPEVVVGHGQVGGAQHPPPAEDGDVGRVVRAGQEHGPRRRLAPHPGHRVLQPAG